MKNAFFASLLGIFVIGCASAPEAVSSRPLDDLLPRPQIVEARDGWSVADVVQVVRGTVPSAPADVAVEAYVLEVSAKGVTITAADPRGERYARVTLDQLKALSGGRVPCCRIVDWPALRWRGFMNDCGRNYLDFDAVKACVDVMAKYKMNLFHWHLADYHGWRLESKKYPQLQRKEAFLRQIGKYYTQEEFKELVRYAAERGVTVMPELDVPGHTLAFRRGMGIETMAAPGTDKVIADLFEELCSLAPAEVMPFIHLGTDEVRVQPEYCDDAWVSKWARTVNKCGRKAVVWAPGKKLEPGIDTIDMAWYDNHITNSVNPVLDSARMYNGSWNPFAVVARTAFTKPCRWSVASGRQIGAITCTWHDDNCGDDNTRLFRDCMVFPAIVGFADNYWRGREADHMELWQRFPAAGTPNFDLLADLERRMAVQRDAFFADFRYPFPFLRQTHMRWRLTDEKGAVLAEAAPQAWFAMEADKGVSPHVPGFTTNKVGCVTAETWIESPAEIDCGAWIDFTCFGAAYGRTSPTPNLGEWNKHGAKIFINGEEIAPPAWVQPNMKATTRSIKDQDVPYTNDLLDKPFADEGCARREPTPIHLKKGVNHVKLVMPKKGGGSKWMGLFSPVLGSSAHPREVLGLSYRAKP